ncbi:MAG: hypothetical protein M1815_002833 [Lichina confinis]|nr:MAG: hypothetical protein M1815_002833 [Lichina confinis]
MSASDDAPSGVVKMDDYVSESGPVPVQKDDAPVRALDQAKADSDEQLQQDEKEAIDKSNIIKDRTRHAKPEGVGYSEGPEEDDLPKNVRDGLDGRSAVHTGILKEPSA